MEFSIESIFLFEYLSSVDIGVHLTVLSVQTDSRLYYPDINNRLQTPNPPTPQPIRRERTFGGFSQSDNDMDPFTKQYYTRMWKQNVSPENV